MIQTSSLAKLSLTAVFFENGEYRPLHQGLLWQLTRLNKKGEPLIRHRAESFDAQPMFEVQPGQYHLAATYSDNTVEITGLELIAGKTAHELIIFQKGVAVKTDYRIDSSEVNLQTEYLRRQLERDAQRKYGYAASELRNPDLIAASHAMGQLMDSGLMEHPILSRSAQFDGIAAKLTQAASDNQHAAEAQIQPELRPGARPQAQPQAAPHAAPLPTPKPF